MGQNLLRGPLMVKLGGRSMGKTETVVSPLLLKQAHESLVLIEQALHRAMMHEAYWRHCDVCVANLATN